MKVVRVFRFSTSPFLKGLIELPDSVLFTVTRDLDDAMKFPITDGDVPFVTPGMEKLSGYFEFHEVLEDGSIVREAYRNECIKPRRKGL